ncbi:MAG: aldehyde dehydrogenase family protein, partial [Rectinemataceae bacterium]|nr:aldehyde dehydrogenase family protein [Rectinemataceae bacterium]
MEDATKRVAALIERARKAQAAFEYWSQEQVDTLTKALVWTAVKPGNIEAISKLAVEESQLGNYQSKYTKLQKKLRGALRDMTGKKSVGIIDEDTEKGIIKIAKPVGVIGALIPCTNPEATPVFMSISAIKGRNAIILAPHPRTKKTNAYIASLLRETLKKYGAPEDLIIAMEEPSMEDSGALMKQCDLIVATGGTPLVKVAYSSGTPAYGVGAGNAVVIVDETADIAEAAHKIMLSKTFDFATSCSSENSILVVDAIYDRLMAALTAEGGYLVDAEGKKKLQNLLWEDGHLSRNVTAQPAARLAAMAGIELPEGRSFFMVPETGVGPDFPFSGEKMCVVLTVYRVADFNAAVDMVNAITSFQGMGHSCGLYSVDRDRIVELGLRTKVSRIMIRQPQCYGNTGNWENGMPFTMTLGCGTWGGNITTENVHWKHMINVTWVSLPIVEKI